MEEILVLADPNRKAWDFANKVYEKLNNNLNRELKYKLREVEITKFNDGEILTKIKESVRTKKCYFIHDSSMDPQDWFVSLAFLKDDLIRSDINEINFVLPYMKYSRQDRMTEPRTPVSTSVVAKNLQAEKNVKIRIITTDMHNPSVINAYSGSFENLRAYAVIIDYLKKNHPDFLKNALLVAPDSGAMQITGSYAKRINLGIVSAYKKRERPGVVEEIGIIGDVKGKNTIITDDMIDTGGTLCKAAEVLKEKGARNIYACATHGIFSKNAREKLNNSCLERIIITDSIPQNNSEKIEVVSISNLIAETIYRISHGISVSELY